MKILSLMQVCVADSEVPEREPMEQHNALFALEDRLFVDQHVVLPGEG
jgi:hypothetical protein